MKKKAIFIITAALLLLSVFLVSPLKALAYDELKNTDPDKYYILLDLKNQIVTVFERDENGDYTKIVRRFICTSGRTEVNPEDPEDVGTPTPKGIWKIGARERFGEFAAFDGTYARYWTQIVEGVYFTPSCTAGTTSTRCSGGFPGGWAARLSWLRAPDVEDAKWLYYYACPGTTINVSPSEPSNRALTKKLRTNMSFNNYKAFQTKYTILKSCPTPRPGWSGTTPKLHRQRLQRPRHQKSAGGHRAGTAADCRNMVQGEIREPRGLYPHRILNV